MSTNNTTTAGTAKTVAQLSIDELIDALERDAGGSRAVGNIAIGASIAKTAAFLRRETQDVFNETARLTVALAAEKREGKKLREAMAGVERAHFRTVTDTGANPNAMVVWNALRSQLGLPSLSKDDLPAWDEAAGAYVRPPNSNLLPALTP